MIPTSSLALVFIGSLVVLILWSLGITIRSIPSRIGGWLHARKLRKLALREARARAQKAEAEADAAVEARDTET